MTIQDESGVCITPAGRVLITSTPDEEASLGAALMEELAAAFWGKAWCDNRLPRGRTYVRNGSVIDLKIAAGQIRALVSGSDIYNVTVDIAPVALKDWKTILSDCSRSVDSLMDLLQGRFSKGVMERLTRQREGLFPQPREIKVRCSCPDYATMCKHVAAVLYGVGARLDVDPRCCFCSARSTTRSSSARPSTARTSTRRSKATRTRRSPEQTSARCLESISPRPTQPPSWPQRARSEAASRHASDRPA